MKTSALLAISFWFLAIGNVFAQTPPTITSISPSSGASGSSLTIIGTDFGATIGENRVLVGGNEAAITSANSSTIMVTLPTALKSHALVSVTNTTSGLQAVYEKPYQVTFTGGSIVGVASYDTTHLNVGFRTANDPVVGDFNNDGNLDFLAIHDNNTTDNVRFMQGNGDGTFTNNAISITAIYTKHGEAADFNNDGNLDFIVGDRDNSFDIALGAGDGTFTATNYTGHSNHNDVGVGDFNGDGWIDAALSMGSNTYIKVLLNDSTGQMGSPATYSIGSTGAQQLEIADFNLDGILDIGTAYGTTFAYIPGNGDGTFGTELTASSASVKGGITSGDFNGDGYLDVVTVDISSPSTSITILLNDGSGDFTGSITNYSTGIDYPGFLHTGDFDGDGALDVTLGSNDGNLKIMLGNGAGAFTAVNNIPIGSGNIYNVNDGDFNNDGKTDLIVSVNNNNPEPWGYTLLEYTPPPLPFITTWITNNGEIVIPTSGVGYNYDITWTNISGVGGDGSHTSVTGNDTITGLNNGDTYQIEITGDFPRIYFNFGASSTKIQSIEQWGDITWSSMQGAFLGCTNLVINATDAPDLTNVTSMINMFNVCSSLNQDISHWDVSTITNMAGMFNQATSFNQDLSAWDFSNVTDMTMMFNGASAFDQNLGNWDISTVTDMTNMLSFSGLSKANYDATLIGWSNQTVQSAVTLGATDLNYCNATSAVATLTSQSWVIGGAPLCSPFITTWVTNNGQITIPTTGSGYNYSIHWENLQNPADSGNVSGLTGNHTITGLANDTVTYQVEITGSFPRIYFNNTGDRLKIVGLSQWGEVAWTSMNAAFRGCSNLIITATDAPDFSTNSVSDLSYMFSGVFSANTFTNADFSAWNTSSVTDMSYLFDNAGGFNLNINSWDVSNVTNMLYTFNGTATFNQPLDNWIVSSVTSMESMFYESAFNQPINNWDVSSVTTMFLMFGSNTAFNQPLDAWNVGGVTNFSYMFNYASQFNGDVSNWNTISAIDMNFMFEEASSFNQNLGGWDVSNVTDMSGIFDYTGMSKDNLKLSLDGWAELTLQSSVTLGIANLDYCDQWESVSTLSSAPNNWILSGGNLSCTPFITKWITGDGTITIPTQGSVAYSVAWYNETNTGIGDGDSLNVLVNNFTITGLEPSSVYRVEITGQFPHIYFHGGLEGQDVLKIQSIEQWGEIAWTSMANSFQGCTNLIVNTTDAPNLSGVTDLSSMFREVNNGNAFTAADLSGWDVSKITNMSMMFNQANNFNKDISSWNVERVKNMSNMFYGASAFNQPLNTWAVDSVTNMSEMFYNAVAFDQALNNWNTGSVTNMSSMFQGATSFNQDIDTWDVSNVTSFYAMFFSANSFNQDLNSWNIHDQGAVDMQEMFNQANAFNGNISNWDVSTVTNMSSMFRFTPFNQDLSAWDVSSVTSMGAMFYQATAFNQNLGDWQIPNVTNLLNMLDYSALSKANYDATLIGWSGQTVQDSLQLGAQGLIYCNGSSARTILLSAPKLWTIVGDTQECNSFITKWLTNNGQITIPTTGIGYNYAVTWTNLSNPGIGEGDTIAITGDVTIQGLTNGDTIQVEISGDFPRIYFNDGAEGQDELKIISIEQWGDIAWATMENSFFGCVNLVGNASDVPNLSAVTSIRNMFARTAFNSNINNWDVSNVTSMNATFAYTTDFNQPLDAWEVGMVTDMSYLFYGATVFNQPLNGWSVDSVTNMNNLFAYSSFNQPLNNWNVANVVTMNSLFMNTPFNQDIGNWNVGNVTNMRSMFQGAANFNQDLSGWPTVNVTDMQQMFESATAFNNGGQPLLQNTEAWNVSSVTNMWSMFNGATSFNQSLGTWDVSLVNTMVNMLSNTALSTANYDATLTGWSALSLQDSVSLGATGLTYCHASAARSVLTTAPNSWTITGDSQVCTPFRIQMYATGGSITIPTFPSDTTYNYNVTWANTNVTNNAADGSAANQTTDYTIPGLFDGDIYLVEITGDFPRIYFNSGSEAPKLYRILDWGDIQWTSMQDAFSGCSNLALNAIDAPNLSNVTDVTRMFAGANNLNDEVDYIGNWDVSNVQYFTQMFNGCTNFNEDISGWDVSSAYSMGQMFQQCTQFNQNIGSWDVSNVNGIFYMFYLTGSFNQDISGWDVSSVTNFDGMFREATAFNQDLSAWNVSGATVMSRVFQQATAFNQSLAAWDVSQVTDMEFMLDNSGLNLTNYDATLSAWSNLPNLQDSVTLGATGLLFCTSNADRLNLISTYGWTIDGDTIGCPPTPSNILILENNPGQLTIEWYDAENEEGYHILAAYDESFTTAVTNLGSVSGFASFTDNLGENASRYYKVVAYTGTYSDTSEVNFGHTYDFAHRALSFDGVDDYVSAPLSSIQTDNFTIEAWVNLATAPSGSQIIAYNGNSGNSGYGFITNTSQELQFLYGGIVAVSTGYYLPTNDWVHIAATRESGILKVYVNNIQQFLSDSITGPAVPTEGFFIGASNVGNERFDGKIDEVKLWNVAKTDFSTRASYEPNNYGGSGLVAYYTFDENVGTTLFDQSVNTNNGTLNNNPNYVSSLIPEERPSANNSTIFMNEDAGAVVISPLDFNFIEDDFSDSISSIIVQNLTATTGLFEFSGSAVTASQEIALSQFGLFTYTPNANLFGSDTLSFLVIDAGGDTSLVEAMLIINVNSVEDFPVVPAQNFNVSVNTIDTLSFVDFGYFDQEGDSLFQIEITSVSGIGQLQLNGVEFASGTISFNELDSGKLRYYPAFNALGDSIFNFTYYAVNDDETNSISDTVNSYFSIGGSAQPYTSVSDGIWEDPNTWLLGEVPTANSGVLINDEVSATNITITLDSIEINNSINAAYVGLYLNGSSAFTVQNNLSVRTEASTFGTVYFIMEGDATMNVSGTANFLRDQASDDSLVLRLSGNVQLTANQLTYRQIGTELPFLVVQDLVDITLLNQAQLHVNNDFTLIREQQGSETLELNLLAQDSTKIFVGGNLIIKENLPDSTTLTFNGNSELHLSGTILRKDNSDNDNALGLIRFNDQSSIHLEGTTFNQALLGNAVVANDSVVYNKIYFNNTSGQFPEIILTSGSDQVIVRDTVFMQNGRVDINFDAGNNFIFDKNAQALNSSTSSYFARGGITKIGTGDFLYPIGSETQFAPIYISMTGGDGSTYLKTSYTEEAFADGFTLPGSVVRGSAKEYWYVEAMAGLEPSTLTPTMYVMNGNVNGVDNLGDLTVLAKFEAAINDLAVSNISGSLPGPVTLEADTAFAFTSNAAFSFGSTNPLSNPLGNFLLTGVSTYTGTNADVVDISGLGFSPTAASTFAFIGGMKVPVSGTASSTQLDLNLGVSFPYGPLHLVSEGKQIVTPGYFNYTFQSDDNLDATSYGNIALIDHPEPIIYDFEMADMNGDQIMDIVLLQAGAGDLRILLGNGSGGFSESHIEDVPAKVKDLAIGDMDNDGDLDVVVIISDMSTDPTVYYGLGDGTLDVVSTAFYLPSAIGYSEVKLGDINNDNYLDILVSSYNAGPPYNVSAMISDAGTDWVEDFNYQVSSPDPIISFVAGYFEGLSDTSLDVVISNAASQITYVYGANYGSPSSTGSDTYGNISVIDIDDDGFLDIMITDDNRSDVNQFINSNGTGFIFSDSIAADYPIVAAGNLNGDGKPDAIVISKTDSSFIVGRNDLGSLLFENPGTKNFPHAPRKIMVADITSDNIPDLILLLDSGIWYMPADLLASEPLALTGITGTYASDTISLSWNAEPSATGYVVLRYDADSVYSLTTPEDRNTYSVNDIINDAKVAYAGPNTSFEDADLIYSANYLYQVFSYNDAGGAINYTASSSDTTIQAGISLVSGFEVSNVSATGLTISWLPTPNADDYRLSIYYDSALTDFNANYLDVTTGGDTLLVATNLKYSSELFITINAIDNAVDGPLELFNHTLPSSSRMQQDSTLLVDIYTQTGGGTAWTDTTWLVGRVDTWNGVSVMGDSVLSLNLSGRGLTGSIPPSLYDLVGLQYLYLQSNPALTGSISTDIANLDRLSYIDISNTGLSGNIPDVFAAFDNLNIVDLSNNQFTGAIPQTLADAPNVSHLYFDNNQFTEAPDFAIQYDTLALDNNNFQFGSLEYNTDIINISYQNQGALTIDTSFVIQVGNPLVLTSASTGSSNLYTWFKDSVQIAQGASLDTLLIPSAVLVDAGVYYCEVSNGIVSNLNLYSGSYTISTSARQADSLALIAIYNNLDGANWTNPWLIGSEPMENWTGVTITNNRVSHLNLGSRGLTGTIPAEIGDLTELVQLDLSSNAITGNIPVEIGSLVNLFNIYLYSNQLTGSLPNEIGQILGLYNLNLNFNDLSGSIPISIGNLSNLNTFQAVDNLLTGSIPVEFGQLTGLSTLSLNGNQLSGSIPSELGNLQNLYSLGLSNNQLTGTIPASLGNLTNPNQLYLGGNQLTGALPDSITTLTSLQYLWIESNNLDALPDLSPMVGLISLSIDNNKFDFEDLEPNATVINAFAPNTYQQPLTLNDTLSLQVGNNLFLSVITGGANNTYQWQKNYADMVDSTSNSIDLSPIKIADAGHYRLRVSNTLLPGVLLQSGFTVVNTSSLLADSLALVALYVTTDSANWINKWNIDQPLTTWFGVVTIDNTVTQLNLSSNGLNGSVPTDLLSMTGLTSIDFSNNNITTLPAFDTAQIVALHVDGNRLDFASLEPLMGIDNFTYSGQQILGSVSNYNLQGGDSQMLSVGVGGTNNLYQWFKDITPIAGATLTNYNLLNAQVGDAGTYTLQVSNSVVPGLTLTSADFVVNVSSLVADSLALIALYNATDGPNWTNTWDLGQPMSTWYGVFMNANSVTDLLLGANNLVGYIPTEIAAMPALSSLSLEDNAIDALPDFSSSNLVSLNVVNNNLDFADLENATSVPNFFYGTQNAITANQNLVLDEGSELFIQIPVGGTINTYQWYKNGLELVGETTDSLKIPAVTTIDVADYQLQVTNAALPDLTLFSGLYNLELATSLTDSLALVDLYNTTNGASWINNTNWLSGSLETWNGVILQNGRVQALNLSTNNLSGTLPESLGNLTALSSSLQLSQNNLSGPLPTSLGNLNKVIYVDFSFNQLSGDVPASIVNMDSLANLVLSENNFENLPDLTAKTNFISLEVFNNRFEFDDFEANLALLPIIPNLAQQVLSAFDTTVMEGTNLNLTKLVGGANNLYQWNRNGADIGGANSNTLSFVPIQLTDQDVYQLVINNSVVTGLSLTTNLFNVTVTEDLSDVTAPFIDFASASTINSTPVLSGFVDDSTATITVYAGQDTIPATISGQLWEAQIFSPLSTGLYNVRVVALDSVLNVTDTVFVDALEILPIQNIIISNLGEGTNLQESIVYPVDYTTTVNMDTDEISIEFSTDGTNFTIIADGVFSSYPSPYNFIPTEQTETAYLRIRNVSLDVITTVGPFIINPLGGGDATSPIIDFVDVATTNVSPLLTGFVNDSTASLTVYVGSDTISAIITGQTWSAQTITPLTTGLYNVRVLAVDTALNVSDSLFVNGLEILTAPEINITNLNAGDSLILGDVFLVNYTTSVNMDSDLVEFQFSTDGANFTISGDGIFSMYGGSFNLLPQQLANTAYFKIVNTSLSIESPVVGPFVVYVPEVIDVQSPLVNITPMSVTETLPLLTGSIDDSTALLTVYIANDTLPATINGLTWQAQVQTALTAGLYNVRLLATDLSGNVTDSLFVDAVEILSEPSLMVVAPTGLDSVATTGQQLITWTSEGMLDSDLIEILVSTDGTNFSIIADGNFGMFNGSYMWPVNVPASESVTIRVVNTSLSIVANSSVFKVYEEAPASIGYAVSFVDFGSHIAINDAPQFDIDSDFTIETWIKTSAGGQQAIIAQNSGSNGYYLFLQNSTLYMQYFSGGFYINGSGSLGVTVPNLNDGNWHHIAVSQNGSNGYLYADGVLVQSIGNMFPIDESTGTIHLGYHPNVGPYNGAISEVRFWNTHRTDTEIADNYNRQMIGIEPSLAVYYPFFEGSGGSVNDIMIGQNHGTLTNMNLATSWVDGPVLGEPLFSYIPVIASDSLALRAIYDATNGANWTTKWDVTKPVSTWYGVTIVNDTVRGVVLSSNNLTGSMPTQVGNFAGLQILDLSNNNLVGSVAGSIVNLVRLQNLRLSNNNLTFIPDVTSLPNLIELSIENNQFDFQTLLSLSSISGIMSYSPQAPISVGSDYVLNVGEDFTLSLVSNGVGNLFSWYRDTVNLGINTTSLDIPNIQLVNAGQYQLQVTNPQLPDLTLLSGIYNVTVTVPVIPILESDSLALVTIYQSMGDTAWVNDANWLVGSVETWQGVTIEGNRVIGLQLSGNNMSGPLSPAFGNLSALRTLVLNGNTNVGGSIPVEFANLTQLQTLFITSLGLTGNVPDIWAGLTSLRQLDFGQNLLSGTLPNSIYSLTNLEFLGMAYNDLSGALSADLGNLTSLQQLYLDQNNFEGAVPTSLTNLANLTSCSFDNNNFTDFPDVSAMNISGYFNISNNLLGFDDLEPNVSIVNLIYSPQNSTVTTKFVLRDVAQSYTETYVVPGSANTYQWFKNGQVLAGQESETLELNNLTFEDEGLYQLQITNLLVLDVTLFSDITDLRIKLSSADSLALVNIYQNTGGATWTNSDTNNWLTGPVNTWAGVTIEQGRVTRLNLGNNNLTGNFPTAVLELTELRELHLNQNTLTGELPDLGFLSKLEILKLFQNNLSGTVPGTIGTLLSLRDIDLGGNAFSGAIPNAIYGLSNLEILGLANNQLTGGISTQIGNLEGLKSLFLDVNNLEGTLPTELGNLIQLEFLFVQGNQFEGAIPNNVANLTKLKAAGFDNNNFESLPNLSGLDSLNYFNVSENKLDYADLEPNISIVGFIYAPQQVIGTAEVEYRETGGSLEINKAVGGESNNYQWFKDGEPLSGETNSSITINDIDFVNEGDYVLTITNNIVQDLTLSTAPLNLRVSSLARDSAALREIYVATNATGWNLSANLSTWTGVQISNSRVTGLNLSSNTLKGNLPEAINDIRNLQTVNISNNQLTGLPAISLTQLTQFNVSNNRLEFDDIVPNLSIVGFNFTNQQKFGNASQVILDVHSAHNFTVSSPGNGNQYQWFRNGALITGANTTQLQISDLVFANMGDYHLEITNPLVSAVTPGFKLTSETQTVLAKADITGFIKDLNDNLVNAGEVYLFKVNEGAKYDTIRFEEEPFVNIQTDGSYFMQDVILGNYLLLADPDVTEYPELLPSYYKGTIDWDLADVLQFRDDAVEVNITMEGTPAPRQGVSVLAGFLEEEDGESRLLARARVGGGGVTVRRTSDQGRGNANQGELVAFVKTDENGEFLIDKLTEGNYTIKINYPGVPMDEGSDVAFSLKGFNSEQLNVAATVIDGKIQVEQLSYTGIYNPDLMPALNMFPNPTTDLVNIQLLKPQSSVQVQVLDMSGRTVANFEADVKENKLQFSADKFVKGLYLVKLLELNGNVIGQSKLLVK